MSNRRVENSDKTTKQRSNSEVGGMTYIPRNLGCGKAIAVYAVDISIIVSEVDILQKLSESIKYYEGLVRAILNRGSQSVCMRQFDTT